MPLLSKTLFSLLLITLTLMCSGVARVYAKQKEIRDRNPDTTIFLNGGY